ncbi:ATP-binding protein [Litchfieldia salsa]|uniref:histidine kinase n=1 Tax=Litchfieldia salsa TaxID=930152 RepID=A0A1H0PDP5_9BACI|nr:ATP-binding protein [Litchfieldia salsa]SDP02736.1 two-component system, sporulation sensor kinase A [Litchfieldia salsa]
MNENLKDITLELQRANHINQLILDSVAEGIYGIDLNANVIFWNKSAEELTGFTQQDFETQNLHDLTHHTNKNGEHVPLTQCPVYHALNNGNKLFVEDDIFWKKDGTSFPVEYTINPMYENGTYAGTVITFRDMTEKMKTEELLLQSEKLSSVGKIAAGIAHEIRNPLTSIKGFLQLIADNPTINKEYLSILDSEFDRIESIIKDLLVFSKPQQEQYLHCNIVELIEQVVFLMQPQATLNNVEMITQFEEENILFYCIPHQIKQVIINLLKNGTEAIENGGHILIKISKRNNFLNLIIQDSGKGMTEEELKKLGTPFHSTKQTGTGLGIMMTENIIKNNHKGFISVESVVNQGTTFTIQLPLSLEHNEEYN